MQRLGQTKSMVFRNDNEYKYLLPAAAESNSTVRNFSFRMPRLQLFRSSSEGFGKIIENFNMFHLLFLRKGTEQHENIVFVQSYYLLYRIVLLILIDSGDLERTLPK